MNTPDRHQDDLSSEQAVNERYLRRAQEWRDRGQRLGSEAVPAPRSAKWVDEAPKMPITPTPRRLIAPLLGRVALSESDQDLGRGFYVGSCFTLLEDGVTVVNWTAGVASLFFDGRGAANRGPESPQPRSVAGTRSFKALGDRLVDFEDDIEADAPAASVFASAPRLEVPEPPPATPQRPVVGAPSLPAHPQSEADRSAAPAAGRPRRSPTPLGDERPDHQSPDPAAKKRRPATTPPAHDRLDGSQTGTAVEQPVPTVSPPSSASPAVEPDSTDSTDSLPLPDTAPSGREDTLADAVDGPERASRLLGEALEAPKTGTLAPVLATLQPEQYRLVTWSLERNLLVQGHPGTGKTIVAAHRAAFLVLPKGIEGQDPGLSSVALVGPTDRWKRYIEPSVGRLVEEGVEVLSLESLVRQWSGSKRQSLDSTNERWFHCDWEIGRVVERAAFQLDSRLRKLDRRVERARLLVNELVQDTTTHRFVLSDSDNDLKAWLLKAERYENIRKNPSYLLFLAAVGLATGRRGDHIGYQHIVVDEAQDLRPLEWRLLTKLHRPGAEPRWSLLGDMNQRRSDFTWDSWEQLADRLELATADSPLEPPVVLGAGYRSTREILRYADALLPRGMRGQDALRRGPEPSVRRVGKTQIVTEATNEALGLASHYPGGSVAVVASDQIVRKFEKSLRRSGWHRDPSKDRGWQHGSDRAHVTVGRPVEVRGLEFDAVVVVEPADFKQNMGRHGELYTSLTRANKELAIVHSKAMPRELKGRGNRVK